MENAEKIIHGEIVCFLKGLKDFSKMENGQLIIRRQRAFIYGP